jgi:hypothetical protein
MKVSVQVLAAVVAVALGAVTPLAGAQEAKKEADKPSEKIIHPGGPRHDKNAHENAVRAKREGAKMQEPTVHPGGRHNEQQHKAAIQAERDAAAKDSAKK